MALVVLFAPEPAHKMYSTLGLDIAVIMCVRVVVCVWGGGGGPDGFGNEQTTPWQPNIQYPCY